VVTAPILLTIQALWFVRLYALVMFSRDSKESRAFYFRTRTFYFLFFALLEPTAHHITPQEIRIDNRAVTLHIRAVNNGTEPNKVNKLNQGTLRIKIKCKIFPVHISEAYRVVEVYLRFINLGARWR